MNRRTPISRAAYLVLLAAVSAAAGIEDDAPAPAGPPKLPAEGPPTYILLEPPANLEALLEGLKRPDFTLRPGGGPPATAPGRPAAGGAAVVERLAVRGEVADDLARLTVGVRVAVDGEGPQWAAVGLDGLTLGGVVEAGRELPRRVGTDGAWEVELEGAGRHDLEIELLAPVRPSAEGRRVELAVPEAAATSIDLVVPGGVTDALAGGRDPIAAEPAEGGRARLAASLTPRRRIELSWRAAAEPGAGPALLAAQGAIAVDIDPGSVRTSASWLVRADRGRATSLALRLDPDEEVVGLDLDGRPLPPEAARAAGAEHRLTIPLAEPLRRDSPRRLVITTRRPWPAAPAPLVLRGTPLEGVAAQSGVVAIARGAGLWVRGQAGRGVRQVDPKADLPADLRARPGTVLAYQFYEQPFELALRVEPAAPLVRAESQTTVAIEPTRARVETWLDYQVTGGRVFDVQIRLPRGLELDSAGPEAIVDSYHLRDEPADEGAPDGQRLTVQLSPRARDDGRFRLRLVGRQAMDPPAAGDPPRTVAVGLFQPVDAAARGAKVAVVTARNVVVDLPDEPPGHAPAFAPAPAEAVADWPKPPERLTSGGSAALAAALWLRGDGGPAALPLAITVYPRSIGTQTVLNAAVDRRRLEVRQETTVQVRHGALSRLDVAVPRSLEGHWEIEGDEVAGRESLGPGPGGELRYRLALGRESSDAVTLRFRYRLAIEPGLSAEAPLRLEIPPIRPLDGRSAPTRVLVAADAAIGLEPAGASGWAPLPEEELPPAAGGASPRLGLVGEGPNPPAVRATALALAGLPGTVVSRLWLRTAVGPEGDVRAEATFRVEPHAGALEVALPRGAELVGARVGGDPAASVERLAEPAGYRVRLPGPSAGGPAIVRLDYAIPARSLDGDWGAPRLLGGGVVQQSCWELRLPWNRAIVGVPPGWADENEWFWDGYVWKRRPARDDAALAAWAGSAPAEGAATVGDHAYLFGRPGAPPPLRPLVVGRPLLVGLFSGLVLVVGVPLLVYRPPLQAAGVVGLALAVAVAAAVEPSVALLAVQSAAVGLVLLALAALTQRLVDRRRGGAGPALLHDPSGVGGAAGLVAPGSSRQVALDAGSDESTIVRPRPGTTIDRIAAPAPEGAAAEGGRP